MIGQVTRFDGRFIAFALALLGLLVVIGTLTQMRVGTAALEDLGHVIGMNRLRAGYLELDPTIERFLVTSAHDDDRGVWHTYNPLGGPRSVMGPLASTGAFITVVTAGLTGAFGALLAIALRAPGWVAAVVGFALGLCYIVLTVVLGIRQFGRIQRSVLFPGREGNADDHG